MIFLGLNDKFAAVSNSDDKLSSEQLLGGFKRGIKFSTAEVSSTTPTVQFVTKSTLYVIAQIQLYSKKYSLHYTETLFAGFRTISLSLMTRSCRLDGVK